MLIALTLAYFLPAKLFLWVYAFLGPLHYLTEIFWLHRKNYFTSQKAPWLPIFIGISLLMLLPLAADSTSESVQEWLYFIPLVAIIAGTGFGWFAQTTFKKGSPILWISLITLLSIGLFFTSMEVTFFLAVLLPTLIHVYLFTTIFMFEGAKKSSSSLGFVNVFVLILVPFIILFMPDSWCQSNMEDVSWNDANMRGLILSLQQGLGNLSNSETLLFRIKMFVSFAYTFHYLNWFSKIHVIGWWRGLKQTQWLWIAGIYLLSIGLYIYDFRTGFVALIALSFAHVFLELPLDFLVIKRMLGLSKT